MAFPAIVNTAESALLTAGTSHIVTLPASLVSGNLIIILCSRGVGAASFNALAGWTELVDDGVTYGVTVWARQSDGAEGASVTFTSTGSAVRSAHISYQISGAEALATQAPELSTVATATSNAPNATACTPTGGAKDYLWISFFSMANEEADDDTWVTSAPAGYTGLLQKTAGIAGTNLGGLVASAHRTANAASEDAGAFGTAASLSWRAHTMAVHPSSAPPAAPPIYPTLQPRMPA